MSRAEGRSRAAQRSAPEHAFARAAPNRNPAAPAPPASTPRPRHPRRNSNIADDHESGGAGRASCVAAGAPKALVAFATSPAVQGEAAAVHQVRQ